VACLVTPAVGQDASVVSRQGETAAVPSYWSWVCHRDRTL